MVPQDIRLLILTGPTCSGKTEYGIHLAKHFDGEIISADSMQIYKHMNIGTAKPDLNELNQVNHHLIDFVNPFDEFTVADYRKKAKALITDISNRNKLPIILGGTGLYINSLIYEMDFQNVSPDYSEREKLEEQAKIHGNEYLHNILKSLSETAAERIHPNNTKRVIRAIEILRDNDEPLKDFSEDTKLTKDYKILMLGLTFDRATLYDRINKRVFKMMEDGLLDEVKSLISKGLTEKNKSMLGIGYKEFFDYFNGKCDIFEVIKNIQKNTRRYAKRQLTWFSRYERINWYNRSNIGDDVLFTVLEEKVKNHEW